MSTRGTQPIKTLAAWAARPPAQLLLLASVAMIVGLCSLVFSLRAAYSRDLHYSFLLTNLALGLIPVIAGFAAYNLGRLRSWLSRPVILFCAAVWFIFLPNAFYLVTDLTHYRPREGAAGWIDLAMFITFAWAGTLLGVISLSLMQRTIQRLLGPWLSWLVTLGALAANGFGLYLGRIMRWNSWDVLLNGRELVASIVGLITDPHRLMVAAVYSGLFALLFGVMYLTLKAIVRFEQPDERQAQTVVVNERGL